MDSARALSSDWAAEKLLGTLLFRLRCVLRDHLHLWSCLFHSVAQCG